MNKKKKLIILIVLTIAIIVVSTVLYYIYCQNKKPSYIETEEISSYIENDMKKDAQEILDKITKKYGNITFEYSRGKHDIEEGTNIITYYILYNGKKTSLSLDFETVDNFDITKITFNANMTYATIDNNKVFSDIFVIDKEVYSRIIVCILVSLPDSIDEDTFSSIDIVNLYKELYEKEQISKNGYDISVKKYTSDLIIYIFEKVKFSMN